MPLSATATSASSPDRWSARSAATASADVVYVLRMQREHRLVRVVPGTITFSENIVCVICQTSAVIFSKNASSSGVKARLDSTIKFAPISVRA